MSQKKWNLQDIRPAGSAKRPTRQHARPSQAIQQDQVDVEKMPQRNTVRPHREVEEQIDPDIASIEVVDGKSARAKRTFLAVALAIVLIVAAFSANMLLGGAEVTIEPRSKEISVQSEFTAYMSPDADSLGYELLSLEADAETQVKAAGVEEVSEQATGKIFIYNTANPSPQRLITNTRFESPEGLIFRIKESIEVPGITKDSEGNVIPGQIVAEVFADGPGEQYNIGPSRFTVPGLKGTPQYDSVYAESTSGFDGGFEGERYMIEEEDLQVAKQKLHTDLRNSLLQQLETQTPNGFVVFRDAVTFTFESLPSTEYGSDLATIKEQARLHVPMFVESEFSSFLAELSIPDYKDEKVTLSDPYTLSFEYAGELVDQSDISETESLNFTLRGITDLLWVYEPDKLRADLAGINEKETAQVFAKYPAIEQATTELRPFWATSFPSDLEKIEIFSTVESE